MLSNLFAKLKSNHLKFLPIWPGIHITGVTKKRTVTILVIIEIKSLYLKHIKAKIDPIKNRNIKINIKDSRKKNKFSNIITLPFEK
tara:strand:- start:88 stop:345 length:258 start_codon:yes stop_codon:yes gene_type:complete